jgi:hypothetical protein
MPLRAFAPSALETGSSPALRPGRSGRLDINYPGRGDIPAVGDMPEVGF